MLSRRAAIAGLALSIDWSCLMTHAWSSQTPISSTFSTPTNKRFNQVVRHMSSPAKVVEFAKYEGLGNDFILIDDRESERPSLTPEQSQKLCDRHFGIGGDGVIFALQPSSSSEYDVGMRIYNSDGSEPEMCGNGIRCLAKFLQDRDSKDGASASASSYKVDTLAGLILPVMNDNGEVTVDMGEPILDGPSVPTTLEPNSDANSVVEQSYTNSNTGKTFMVNAVSMGNPHAIIFVNDLEEDIDFNVDGPAIESDVAAFPAKINVEFVQVMSPSSDDENHLKMKVWERGAGPTLACGTGACALVVAAIRAGKISRDRPTRVTLPGGDLVIEWKESDNHVYMTGPATFTFSGQTNVV